MNDKNPVLPQDRAEDLLDNWRKYGYVMFPQQRRIYEQIGLNLTGSVLEAGCGSGQGAAVMERRLVMRMLEASIKRREDVGRWAFTATDGDVRNVQFARCLYPWISFSEWDVCEPWHGSQYDVVICVECVEHVADPQAAIRNLMAAARREVWISTPNGRGKPRPPSNQFHVQEYTVEEMVQFIRQAEPPDGNWAIHVLGWEDFQPVTQTTMVDPLVYRIVKS